MAQITFKVIFALLLTQNLAWAAVEKVNIGLYSGRAGFFVQRGKDLKVTESAIAMTSEVLHKLESLKLEKLGETRICVVDGWLQSIGYTIFEIKSCEPKQ